MMRIRRWMDMGASFAKRHGRARQSASIDVWGVAALALAALVALPIGGVLVSALVGEGTALSASGGPALPRYIASTALLLMLACSLALVVGTGCAWLVSAARFPGRAVFEWALILPLAVPAYIAGYAYGDLFDFAGPVQSALRELTGWAAGDYAFPAIRSLPGGAFVLGIVLYPYVYLLARAAFRAQAARQFAAARSLGAGPVRAFWRIALPAARPAIAGGLALVGMEVLADFGVAQYFGIATFSTGIFRSWLAMGDRQAALQLAGVMLAFVAVLVALEAGSRRGEPSGRDGPQPGSDATPLITLGPAGRWTASACCALPVVLGFLVPAIHLAILAVEPSGLSAPGDLAAYLRSSLILGGAAALICLLASLLLAFARARTSSGLAAGAIRVSTLGYALPGALLAVGLLAPLAAFDIGLTRFARDALGYSGGLILTGSGMILIYALCVRFLTVAYNTVDAGLRRIPPSLDAAARTLGAAPSRVLARIYVPLLSPSLAAASALVFIDTLRELPATLILRPFNFETIATRTYRLASDERLAEAATPALILIAAGLLPVLLIARSARR
ncbi:MAG: iron ABC transporter permease [Erythrobacter sp.]|nr:iron ABC transporter permease [Erythrobacter sp.]